MAPKFEQPLRIPVRNIPELLLGHHSALPQCLHERFAIFIFRKRPVNAVEHALGVGNL